MYTAEISRPCDLHKTLVHVVHMHIRGAKKVGQRLMTIIVKEEESARDNHILACNLAKYSQIFKKFSLTR